MIKKLILILSVIQIVACAPRSGNVQPDDSALNQNTRIVYVECPISLAKAKSLGYSTNCQIINQQ